MTKTEVFLLDVNVLIALAWPQHIHHDRAREWFDTLRCDWGTTPITELGFVRISTNPTVVSPAVSIAQALSVLADIRAIDGHRFIADGSTFAEPTISLDRFSTFRQSTDVHLVDLAAASGVLLATLDRGIQRMLTEADQHHVFVLP